jgi:MFS transporter, FSR family, fosmidomycin resistance protein
MRPAIARPSAPPAPAAVGVLVALSVSHLLNDAIQSVLPAIYPLLKSSVGLSFGQIGLISFSYQITASVLQPVVGAYTDRRPLPHSLAVGMSITLVGLVLLAYAGSFAALALAAATMGLGSSIFHPEASRLARLASGGKHGFAQSFFQVGGNFGTSFGPLLAAWVVVPYGREHILWFSILAVAGMALMARLGRWYRAHLADVALRAQRRDPTVIAAVSRRRIALALAILGALVFSKYFYLASMTSYYTFYLIEAFSVSVGNAQIYLFAFLFAVAGGTIIGGPVGDRIGRKLVIWISILGVAPFTLALPYAGLLGTAVLSIIIGLILASAFSAILVYALELMPRNVGLVAGLFFGFAFGMAGIGSAVLGTLADHTSIATMFQVASFLPLIGLLAAFLPHVATTRSA